MSGIFVSHSSRNREFVRDVLLPLLQAEGWSPWYSDERITAADQWRRTILAGLESCPWFLVVLSPEAVASEWVGAEVDWAMEHRRGRIIPLLYRDCRGDDLHLLLRNLQQVRFLEDTPPHRARVVQELRRVIGGTQPAVPLPAPAARAMPFSPSSASLPAPLPVPASPAAANFSNGLGMEMIWCPPGTFLMGSPANEEGRSSDETQHLVTLSQCFWIAKYPVTQRQWEALQGNNPSHFRQSGADAPVEKVSWEEAGEFCRKLSQRENQTYELPTEAQWEYACRAGTTGPYAGPSLEEMGWYLSNSGGQTHPVGKKRANPWGIHDMHGNVSEWCSDWYGDYPTGPVIDPIGPQQASYRVFRGGSWSHDAGYCRSANRSGLRPVYRIHLLGFRPVRSQAGR